ncbi:hypothetical protein [Emticicia sp. TH156]|uniref:hypothetical protein n=1 Tax=Emticicia sp. TH156 TaxID=2067454 RepID=UPI000C757F56|nr:hypothetical protein [Emticicia sp. TH156]PLK42124.1 hypothetical protein C0V77_22480 [Emticicia sp. TH156]
MDIDKYNEAIRQKLESIEPTFEENDWAEMQSFMALNAPKTSFWGQYSRLFLYSAGTIVLITSLLFNLKQNYAYTSLLDTNKILLEKINSQEPTKEKVVYQTDTVFLTKYISINQPINLPVVEQVSEDIHVVTQKSENINKQNKEIKDSPAMLSDEKQLKQLHENIAQTGKVENKIIESGNVEKNSITEPLKEEVINDAINKITVTAKMDSLTQTEPIVMSENIPLNIHAINSIPLSPHLYLWSKQQPKIKYNSPFAENHLVPKKRKGISFPSISLDNLKYRVGISLNSGSEEIGGGLLGEVLLNKRWSVNAGLKVLNISGRSYFTAEQFEFDNKQDFRQLYAPFVPLNNDILNIDFQHYLLQIPIGITYHYPLRNDFTLLFSTTTDLNLYGCQIINFDYKEDSRKFGQGDVSEKVSTGVLNNIEFSAGLEKKLNRMVFQVYPYISTQLRETSYKTEEFVIGAKLRFFVNLSK